MKKPIMLLLFILALNTISFATVRTITVANFSFTPALVNAVVGDTIKWSWSIGDHTTTSTSVPTGAAVWDSPISSLSTTFTYVITTPGNYSYQCTPHAILFNMFAAINAQPSSITQTGTTVNSFELKQNYPNPFNPATNINFSIPKSEFVKISVFDLLGREVAILSEGKLNSGSYNVKFDAAKYSSGVYFYKISAGEFNAIKRMLLLK
jgi:plastocyanin